MLENDNIKLRAPEPQDIDFLFDLENDTQLWHVTQTLVPYSRFDMEQYVFSQNRQDLFSAQQLRLMIVEKDKKTLVGTIDLFDVDALNKRAGVGIVIVEEYRSEGFAGQALDLLIEYAFEHLNLNQLYCNIEENNELSMKLFENHGFQTVGLKKDWNIDKNGSFIGEYLLQHLR